MAFELSFSDRPVPLIGLDIGSSSVKLVELTEGSTRGMRLERYAIEPLPRAAVVDGNIDKIDVVAEAIQKAFRKGGFRIKNAALALPASAVITKRVAMPANLSEDELEVQVEGEAAQYLPFGLDEVSLDFQVLGPVQNSPGDVDVLIAASRKEKVEDRMAVVQAAGLRPVIMDVEFYAMRAAIDRLIAQMPGGEAQVIAVVYMGANSTNLFVLHNGESMYEREQPFGGQQLTVDIARTFGLSSEEAEAKKRSGELPESYDKDVLQPFVEAAVTEITRGLQFFFTSTPYTKVDQIMLAGGSAVVPGLAEVLGQRAQVPASLISPFKGMEVSSNLRDRQLRNDAPALLTPCGLAMRSFEA